jgi:small subunit ribosomal protein S6
MQKYEIMVIITNKLAESQAKEQATDSIDKRLIELGATMSYQDFWGSRGFAYKINAEKWGYYYLAQFEIDGQKLDEFKQDLNIDKSVVRFLITKVDKKASVPEKYEDVKKANLALEKAKEAAKPAVQPGRNGRNR